MTNAAAVPFHTGPELNRAINRTDFFRLFKAAAHHYHFDNFALAKISEAAAPFGEREIVITNIAERRASLFIQTLKEALGTIKAKSAQFLTTPVFGKSAQLEGYPATLSSSSRSSRPRAAATVWCSAAFARSRIRARSPMSSSMSCASSTSCTRKS